MKQFNNYDNARKNAEFTGSARLPEGAYVCKILAVKFENGEAGFSDRIALQFDIAEGDQKDFFRTQYENNPNEDKKWKGSVRIYCPKDDGTEKDQWTANAFAKWMAAFEKSNNGYRWEWDENTLKGLVVGIVFGSTGTRINGKDIVYTEPRFAVDVDAVRKGNAPSAKFKAKGDYGKDAPVNSDGFMAIPETASDEIPF